ncbi:MAG: PhzF family phenazine biosynthesis protein [Actinomycetota bacterium]
MEFYQVDVFAEEPYVGNAAAVFPDAGELSKDQMQAIAREMNLSETAFVMRHDAESYDVRIFTPGAELPFAGHPTIGTAWVLRHLQLVTSERVTQRSAAGDTEVTARDGLLWFTRTGVAEADLVARDHSTTRRIAAALGLDEGDIGLEARELGRPGRLMPAFADAGLAHFLVPVKDLEALGRVNVRADLLAEFRGLGVYCFTATAAGAVRARGLFPLYGIDEDPGTGSAVAALGLYLIDRIEDIDLDVVQGVEIKRPCHIGMRARSGSVEVGGSAALVFTGQLESLP